MVQNGTTAGDDVQDYSGSGSGEDVDFGGGDDNVTGSDHDDTFNTGSGNDTVDAATANFRHKKTDFRRVVHFLLESGGRGRIRTSDRLDVRRKI